MKAPLSAAGLFCGVVHVTLTAAADRPQPLSNGWSADAGGTEGDM